MQLEDIREFNADYQKDGTLVWKQIGAPTGHHSKHKRQPKNYNLIDVDKIILPDDYHIDESLMQEIETLYSLNNRLIPCYLNYDHKLISGAEFYEFAKRKGAEKIPFIACSFSQLSRKERNDFAKSVTSSKVGNKKHSLITQSGNTIYLSTGQLKRVNHIRRMARVAKLNIVVFDNLLVSATNKSGEYIFGTQSRGISISSMDKKLDEYLSIQRKGGVNG